MSRNFLHVRRAQDSRVRCDEGVIDSDGMFGWRPAVWYPKAEKVEARLGYAGM
jgi:hypothetical protein